MIELNGRKTEENDFFSAIEHPDSIIQELIKDVENRIDVTRYAYPIQSQADILIL